MIEQFHVWSLSSSAGFGLGVQRAPLKNIFDSSVGSFLSVYAALAGNSIEVSWF